MQKIVEAYEDWEDKQQHLTDAARRERHAQQQAVIHAHNQAADAQHAADAQPAVSTGQPE